MNEARERQIDAVCQARCIVPNVRWDDGLTEGQARIERMLAERQIDALAALQPPAADREVETYAAFQQRRGRLPDLIEEALEIYRGFMLDDDYNAQGCLDKIADKLKSARDFYDVPVQPPAALRAHLARKVNEL